MSVKRIKYIVGNPASGKTTFINRFKQELLDDNSYFILDYNDYKDYSLLANGVTQKEIHDLSVEVGREKVKPYIYMMTIVLYLSVQ